jgi:Protein of unknown function (DUF2905)
MGPFAGIGKLLILIGVILIVLGGILVFLPKIPWLGKLPGDLFFKGEKISFFFPLTTSILISLLLTLLLALFRR